MSTRHRAAVVPLIVLALLAALPDGPAAALSARESARSRAVDAAPLAAVRDAYPRLSAAQAGRRVAGEDLSVRMARRVARTPGVDGVFLDQSGRPVALVPDAATAVVVRRSGGAARVTPLGEAALRRSHDRVVRLSLTAPGGADVLASSVRLASGQVEVTVARADSPVVARLRPIPGVRVVVSPGLSGATTAAAAPSTVGGWTLTLPSRRTCTTGFNVDLRGTTRMLTAGHCAQKLGEPVKVGGRVVGRTAASAYRKGLDVGLVNLYSFVRAPGTVTNRVGQYVRVTGWGDAFEGTRICKYGAYSNRTCGVVTSTWTMVTYDGGRTRITGVHETNARVADGDSGAPVMHGSTAMGVVSGYRGTRDRMVFTPMRVFVDTYHVRLRTR